MYKFILFFLSIVSCTCAYANGLQLESSIPEEMLVQMLTPKHERLSEKLLGREESSFVSKAKPTIIKAYKTEIALVNDSLVHFGYYADGQIITILEDPSGECPPGTQGVFIGDDLISLALSMHIEKLKGIQYIRHDHDSFSVYTNDYGQFVKAY